MVRVDFMEKNTDILHKCEEVLKKLSDVQFNLAEFLKYFQGCVDAGSIPPGVCYKNLQSLHSFDSVIWELLGVLRDYMGNIEDAMSKPIIVCLRKLILKDKQLISKLRNSIDISGGLRDVLIESIEIADYWCEHKWLNGGNTFEIKSTIELFYKGYFDLMHLLSSLGGSIEEHFYWYSELEKSITMACVYAAPERAKENRYEEADKSEEKTYPFLHAADDDLEDPFIM